MLEEQGLIAGQVGRGSFVTAGSDTRSAGVNWTSLLPPAGAAAGFGREEIGFVMSRPSSDLFPLDEFRASCAAVLARDDLADILQLGSPSGYEPLRRRLLDQAKAQHLAGAGDDLIITNGCQQALDLIGRVLVRPGDAVAVEDPVYPGLKNLLTGMGAQLLGIPVGPTASRSRSSERVLRERPRFLVVTSNFQNPTGATLPLEARRELLEAARRGGCAGDRERRVRRTALLGRAGSRAQATGRRRRDGAVAELLEGQLSRAARGMGAGAEAADRPAAPGERSVRPAYGPAIASGAVGVHGIGTAGGAPGAGSRSRAPSGCARRSKAAAGLCRRERAGRSRKAV